VFYFVGSFYLSAHDNQNEKKTNNKKQKQNKTHDTKQNKNETKTK
jgi:hypothetical protein